MEHQDEQIGTFGSINFLKTSYCSMVDGYMDEPDIVKELKEMERLHNLKQSNYEENSKIETPDESGFEISRGNICLIKEDTMLRGVVIQQVQDMFISGPVVLFKWRNEEGWPVEYVSSNVEKVLGYPVPDLISGKVRYSKIIHQEDLEIVSKEVSTNSEMGVSNFVHEPYRIIRKDGKIIWIEDYTSIMRDENGDITHYFGYIVDITKRKSYERELKESQTNLLQAQYIARMGDFVWDIAKGEITWSEGMYNLLKFDKNEVINFEKVNANIRHPEDLERITKWLNDAINSGDEYLRSNNYRLICKDGEVIHVKTNGRIEYQNGKAIKLFGTCQDITELMIAENKLHEIHNELQDAYETLSTVNAHLKRTVEEKTRDINKLIIQKDEFIHMLGHDLKNPMTPIFTLLPLIEKKLDDPKLIEMISVIIKNSKRMKEIIDETLKLARLDDISKTIEPVEFSLNDEIQNIIDENKTLFDENNFKVEIEIDKGCSIHYDKHQFYDLVSNFLTNAVKYTPDDVDGFLRISAECCDDELILSFTDFGCGLTDKQREEVFEKFYKIGTPREGMTSSGLGLSICKRIVEKHDGRIWVDSEGPGKGSTFYVSIKKGKVGVVSHG